jgi:PAS domain S-box-containing protein
MSSEPIKATPQKRSYGDLVIIFVTAIVSFTLAFILDVFDRLATWEGNQTWEITELYFIFIILVFGFGVFAILGIFSMRRWVQLQRELALRKQAQAELHKARDELELRVQERTAELSKANAKLKDEIFERRLAEQALRESEELFRQVITSISDHIYVSIMNEDGARMNRYLSAHIEPLTGYPREKLLEDWAFWPSQIIHPDDRNRAAEQAKQLAQGQSSEVEYRLVRADGEIIWVRDSARAEHITDSSYIVYGVVGDITERKKAEAEIQALNADLERRVIDRTRKLAALYEVTTLANKSLDIKLTLKLALERLLVAMRSTAGAIYLLDEHDMQLSLMTALGLSPEVEAYISQGANGGGLVKPIIEQNSSLIIPNLKADLNAPEVISIGDFRSYVGVPIQTKGQSLGVLSVLGKRHEQFNEGEVALLTSIADQIGVAVENSRLQTQAQQAAVMRERARLARELHDSVTQSLYSLTLFAEAGSELAETAPVETIKHYFVRIGETALQALKEMRLLVYELRPTPLEQGGLVEALRERLNAVEGRVNVKARLVADDLIALPARAEEGLYRIVQEALNNILKHANATSVTIHLRALDEYIELEVIDDGQGFDVEAARKKGGMGLSNMVERAKKLGGQLTIHSSSTEGTKIAATIPVEADLPVLANKD